MTVTTTVLAKYPLDMEFVFSYAWRRSDSSLDYFCSVINSFN